MFCHALPDPEYVMACARRVNLLCPESFLSLSFLPFLVNVIFDSLTFLSGISALRTQSSESLMCPWLSLLSRGLLHSWLGVLEEGPGILVPRVLCVFIAAHTPGRSAESALGTGRKGEAFLSSLLPRPFRPVPSEARHRSNDTKEHRQ